MAWTTLKRWMPRLALSLIVGLLSTTCYIPYKPCVLELESGDKFRVHLLEPYDESSRFVFDKNYAGEDFHPSCNRLDGLVAPAVLDFEILPETEASISCKFKMADLINDSALVPPAEGQGSREAIELNGSGRVVFSASLTQPLESGCKAHWLGNLIAPNGKEGLYAAPVAGSLPPAIFGRRRTSCADTAPTCVDYFAAKVERIP